jgi:hypothetical protein
MSLAKNSLIKKVENRTKSYISDSNLTQSGWPKIFGLTINRIKKQWFELKTKSKPKTYQTCKNLKCSVKKVSKPRKTQEYREHAQQHKLKIQTKYKQTKDIGILEINHWKIIKHQTLTIINQ